MIGLPIAIAALALMGAPTSTPVGCNPETTAAHNALGITYFTGAAPTHIEYAPQVCAGLTYLAASPVERGELVTLNPAVNFQVDEAVALVSILHESHHATGDRDEARTQCAAMQAVGDFSARYVPAPELPAVLSDEQAFNRQLTPEYHLAGCN